MKKALFKFIMLFSGLWKNSRIDNAQLKAIIETKLILDKRRVTTFNKSQTDEMRKYAEVWGVIMYFVFGCFFVALLFAFDHPHTGFTIFFTFFIIILMMTLITDFTEVLIDVRDNYTILPTPVSSQTLTFSRLIHLVLYLSNVVLPLTIPALFYSFIKYGIGGGLIFIIATILAVFLTIIFVNLMYMLLLKFSKPSKFKDYISYFQILFVTSLILAYYTIPYMIDFEQFSDLDIYSTWWHIFLPGTYITVPFRNFVDGLAARDWSYFIGAIIFISLSMYFIIFVLGKTLAQKLMNISYDEVKPESQVINHKRKSSLAEKIGNLLFKNPIERGSFIWGWIMTSRSRDYKVKTYPIFGFGPALFIYFLFSMGRESEGVPIMERISQEGNEILLIYLVLFSILTPISNSLYSDNFKAADLFKVFPLSKAGPIIRGNMYHAMIKFGMPMFLFTLVISLLVWGTPAISSLVVGFINILLVCYLMVLMFMKKMPYADAWQNAAKGSNMALGFVLMFVVGIIGMVHYYLIQGMWVILAYSAVMFIVCFFLHRRIGNIQWSEVH